MPRLSSSQSAAASGASTQGLSPRARELLALAAAAPILKKKRKYYRWEDWVPSIKLRLLQGEPPTETAAWLVKTFCEVENIKPVPAPRSGGYSRYTRIVYAVHRQLIDSGELVKQSAND